MSQSAQPSDPLTPQGGFADLIGYEVGDWREETAEVVLTLGRRHLNRSGIMHGGVLTTLIDTACGYSGCYCEVPGHARRAMTLQLSVQFLAPAQLGDRLSALATLGGGGKSVFFAACEVTKADGTRIGRGEGVFKYMPGSEDPQGVPIE